MADRKLLKLQRASAADSQAARDFYRDWHSCARDGGGVAGTMVHFQAAAAKAHARTDRRRARIQAEA
jgi:hypothetical protein